MSIIEVETKFCEGDGSLYIVTSEVEASLNSNLTLAYPCRFLYHLISVLINRLCIASGICVYIIAEPYNCDTDILAVISSMTIQYLCRAWSVKEKVCRSCR